MIVKMIPPEPYTRYRLWLRAYTAKHEGKPSPEVQVDIGFDLCFFKHSCFDFVLYFHGKRCGPM